MGDGEEEEDRSGRVLHSKVSVVGDVEQPVSTVIVAFSLQPASVSVKQRIDMAKVLIESYSGSQITDAILEEASKLFSENNGIWGNNSGRLGGQQAHYPLHLLIFCREAGQTQRASTESTMAT